MVKYNVDVELELTAYHGNAFSIMGKVISELRRIGVHKEEIEKFIDEAMSGNYDNLLQTWMFYKWMKILMNLLGMLKVMLCK